MTLQVGSRVRFVKPYSTGVMVDGGPHAYIGYETDVIDVTTDRRGVLVRFPPDANGFAPGQFVPIEVVEEVVVPHPGMGDNLEDQLTELIGRPVARVAVWAVDRYFDVAFAVYRLHDRISR